jgi:hypothetical protein
MKAFLILVLLLTLSSLFAVSQYSCMYLAIEPSSLNRALGMNTGVVDIWHNSALLAYANPALPALHEGVSYGWSKNQWLKGSGIDDLYYHSALLNLGWKGIGLTLPAIDEYSKLGIDMDYGTQVQTDEYGNYIGIFDCEEDANVFGVAVNPLTVIRNSNPDNKLPAGLEFALGLNYVRIKSDLGPALGLAEGVPYEAKKAHSFDFGVVASYEYNVQDYLNLQGVIGLALFNLTNSKISYIDADQADPVYRQNNTGFAVSASLPALPYLKDVSQPQLIFFENLLSLRYLTSIQGDYGDDKNILGHGLELGFLDTFFIRDGYYDDASGYISGKTRGWGINLHYRDLVSYTYNEATYPGGELIGSQKSHDHNFTLNIYSIYTLLRH